MTSTETTDPYFHQDPLPSTVREGDHLLLHFADGRQVFAQAFPKWKSVKAYSSCKINKRTYATHNLIGLRYGTVLEVGKDTLLPLAEGENLLPDAPEMGATEAAKPSSGANNNSKEDGADQTTRKGAVHSASNNNTGGTNIDNNDNRDLVDDNTSQKLTAAHVQTLISTTSTPGSHIVAALISNSATFESKTAFSQAKYVKRKQLKYQPRCIVVRVTPATLCAALHLKDAKKISNLREDTLGQILSNANVCAGQRVLVVDTAVQGIVSGSCARRMGGYGTVLGLFAGQQPSYLDVVHRLNLTACERQCLKWVPLGEAFGDAGAKAAQTAELRDAATGEVVDAERRDRERIAWPAPLQPHTRQYLTSQFDSQRKIVEFMKKRSSRFARKLTRHSGLELRALMEGCCDLEESVDATAAKNQDQKTGQVQEATTMQNGVMGTTPMDATDNVAGNLAEDSPSNDNNKIRQCDSLIIASKYDPTATLLALLPYLAPSCPFVIYHEFLEPLLETFRTLQNYYLPDKKHDGDDTTTAATALEKPAKGTPAATPMMLRHNVAINLRLTDTWFREYQVLDGRTHPNMTMSQNGGYLLMGTKLCQKTGTNELTEAMMKEIRSRIGGRRKQQRGKGDAGEGGKKKKKKT